MRTARTIVPVFAYGSNLCVERILARVASARVTAVARLEGHALRFHKRGRDGSAKADAYPTERDEDCVWGVVYELSGEDKAVLDRIEGVGRGYVDRGVDVVAGDSARFHVRVYQAQSGHVDPTLRPFTWYRDLVLSGARQHDLPLAYRTAIESVRTIEDPDRDRHAREVAVLAGAPGVRRGRG